MDIAEENINNWELKVSRYVDVELKCFSLIEQIGEIKTNLRKLIGNQKNDDVIFYKSLVENSYFYLTNSLKIRKIKMLKDINYIYSRLDEKKSLEELDKSNFSSFLKDYRRVCDEIDQAKKNNTALTWVKNDRILSLQEIEKEMNEILDYHLSIIDFFYSTVELEKTFYCGK